MIGSWLSKSWQRKLDREARIARSDIVIDNSTSLDALHERAAVLHETLLARAAAH